MSRFRLPLALAALLALASALVACGGGDENPQEIVESATLQGVESANVDLSVDVNARGKEGGKVNVSLSGPFQSEEGDDLPQLDMVATAKGSIAGEDIDFDGGLVLLPNSAYVTFEGVDYEVDPTTFSFVQSAIEEGEGQQGGGDEGESDGACEDALGELKIGNFVDNLSSDGSAEVDGTTTTKVSGDLDVPAALDALLEVAEDPACESQLGSGGPLPTTEQLNDARREVKGAVKTAHADLYVGDDDIVRRIFAQLKLEPKRSGEGPESVDLDIDLTLGGVNDEHVISAPRSAKPISDLFIKLGINPLELLGLLQGEGEGIGGLLEGLGGAVGGGSGSGKKSGASTQAYLKCLGNVSTAADLQKCAELK